MLRCRIALSTHATKSRWVILLIRLSLPLLLSNSLILLLSSAILLWNYYNTSSPGFVPTLLPLSYELGSVYLQLCQMLDIAVKLVDPSIYTHRFSNTMDWYLSSDFQY